MRLNEAQQLPVNPESDYDKRLAVFLSEWVRKAAQKINGVASGSVRYLDGGASSVPTTGTWAQGDFVRNLNPTEQGTAGSKYVVEGWLCVAGGAPGTWVQKRFLTGN